MTVAIYFDPWRAIADAPADPRHPLSLWRKAIWFKANPRSAAYMRARLAEHFPGAAFIDATEHPDWARALGNEREIVLLYPDAIGLYFRPLERRLKGRAITVLSGRRRSFTLDRGARARLALRRALERTMLVELVIGGAMLIATPFLYALDWARGRR